LEWKGNIRELAGVVKVVLQTTPSEIVEVQDFNKVIQTVIYSKSEVLIPKVIETKSTNIAEITNIDTNTTLKEDLALVDKKKIESTLAKCKGNVSKTAASLGVSRETLHNKIRKYDINIKDYRVRDN
jgi:arginine utilization regulatory protein